MNVANVTPKQKRYLGWATVAALVFGAYFLSSFFIMFVVAAIFGYLFTPLYKRLQRHMGQGAAAALTLLATILAVIIPLAFVVAVSVHEVNHLLDSLNGKISTADLGTLGQRTIDAINRVLESIPFISYRVTAQSLSTTLTDIIQQFGASFVNALTHSISSLFGLISSSIIYIYVFMSLLRHQKKIIEIIRTLNPLGEDVSDLYLVKIGAMVKGTVSGQFIIAVCQGFADAAFIYLGGVHEAFFVFLLLLTALSIIPLGGGILAIPVGIIMMLFGNFWGGLLVILGHLLVTTNIDNVLRPKLVPKAARLDSALMIVSVFAGIGFFGFFGIVIGPVIMIVIVTTLQVFLDVFHNYDMAEKHKQDGGGVMGKLKSFGSRLLGSKPAKAEEEL